MDSPSWWMLFIPGDASLDPILHWQLSQPVGPCNIRIRNRRGGADALFRSSDILSVSGHRAFDVCVACPFWLWMFFFLDVP